MDRGDDGAGRTVLRDRWWPVPGVLAVVGTVVLVGLSQGWVFTSSVVLPENVQIGAPPAASHATTTTAPVPPKDGIVVATARPVVGENAGTVPAARGTPSAAVPPASADVANPGEAANEAPSSPDSVTTTTLIDPPTTTLPQSPTTTTTSTTRPQSTTTTTDDSGVGGTDN